MSALLAHFRKQHRRELLPRLERSLRAAAPRLEKKVGRGTLYAVSLYTSGESDFCYLRLSANTEEGLIRTAKRYQQRAPEQSLAALCTSLRWSTPDWALHGFDKLGRPRLPPSGLRSGAEDAALYECFVEALARSAAGLRCGRGRDDVAFNVTCGDIGTRFFLRGLRALNAPAVVRRVSREWRASLT